MVRKAQRHNQIAQMCEEYLNKKAAALQPDEVNVYIYGFMASDLGLTTEEIRDVMFAVDCGHNGITIRKPAKNEVFW